jgi:hypothetical protein
MPETTRGTEARDAGMQEGMAEATRLTRAGRLEEATALIQRTLGGGISPGTFAAPAETAARSTAPIALPGALTGGVSPVIEPDSLRMRARTPEPEVALAGQFVAGSFTNSAGTRAYRLYVPSGATGQALPLLVMLHGCTQNAEDLAAGTRMNELAESGGFLVVYPDLDADGGVHSGLVYGAAHDMPSAFMALKQGAGDGAPGPGLRRARVHPLRLPRRRQTAGRGALNRPRGRPHLVGREPAQLVHRPPRPGRLGGDGALFPRAPARLGWSEGERYSGAPEH